MGNEAELAGVHHIAVVTEDLDRLVEFYRRVFGADVRLDIEEPGMRHAMIDPQAEEEAVVQSASRNVIDAGLLDKALEAVPDVIRADLEVLVEAVRAAADGRFIFSPETEAASARIDVYCGH